MAVPQIGGESGIPSPSQLPQPNGASASEVPFASTVAKLINDANTQQLQADTSLKQLITGESEDVHDLVLSVAKADLTLKMVLEIRNRLIEAYQEIMRMQV